MNSSALGATASDAATAALVEAAVAGLDRAQGVDQETARREMPPEERNRFYQEMVAEISQAAVADSTRR